MSLGLLDSGLLRSTLRSLLPKLEPGSVVAFRCDGWQGPTELEVDGQDFAVHWCPSTLAIREVLSDEADETVRRIILTERGGEELGLDTTARLFRRRLLEINSWDALRLAFGAVHLDSRLGQEQWLAEALLAGLPAGGYPPVATGTLDLDHAWTTFNETCLGLPRGVADLPTLLRWCQDSAGPLRLRNFDEASSDAIVERIRQRGGVAAALVARLARHSGEPDAVALGLACRAIYGPGDDGGAGAARLEEHLGGVTLPAFEGQRWAEAAEAWVAANPGNAQRDALRRAELFVERFKVTPQAVASNWLRSGYQQRLARFADGLETALSHTPAVLGADLSDLAERVVQHHRAGEAAQRVTMAMRLGRWLAMAEAGQPAPEAVTSFAEATYCYGSDLALVDLARGVLQRGDRDEQLAAVLRPLLDRVLQARERFNRRFGELARGWFESDAEAPSLIPVEGVLQEVVGPVASQVPVLLLVLDGLSFEVFHQLLDDLLDRGWEPRLRDDLQHPMTALATLPGVTKVSRTSLFCGRLEHGPQASERKGFTSHPSLLAASLPNLPPQLLHKADLTGKTSQLAEQVRKGLQHKGRKVIAVVHNAVDDLLSAGDQLSGEWSLGRLRYLEALLDAAAEGGRAVILTGDHGHLPEYGTRLERSEGAGQRHRPADGPPAEGEILIQGRRVVTDAGTLIVPWSETLRYRYCKAGYHGGVSPQELLVPLAVFTQAGVDLEGWRHLEGALPDWWEPSRPGSTPEPPAIGPGVKPKPRSKKAPRAIPEQGKLFSEPSAPTPPPAADTTSTDRWAKLFASEMWQAQTARAGGSSTVPLTRVRSVLDLVDGHGGRISLDAACRALNLGLPRLRSTVTQLQRLLNVDAYPILDLDEAAGELRLARDLLNEQFEL